MTHFAIPDALVRGIQFPRAALRALGEVVVCGLDNAKLLFLMLGNVRSTKTTDISQDELMQRIQTDHAHLILDVRSSKEYKKCHIPGAINIPHDRLDSCLIEIGSHKNNDVVLYCGSGGRVVIAVNILRSAGFSRLLHLDGDMNAWLSNGMLPVAK